MLYSYSVILVLIGCWLAFASAVPTVSRADDDDAQIGGENSALLATLIADAVERRFASIGLGTANAESPRRAVAADNVKPSPVHRWTERIRPSVTGVKRDPIYRSSFHHFV